MNFPPPAKAVPKAFISVALVVPKMATTPRFALAVPKTVVTNLFIASISAGVSLQGHVSAIS
jgi:hypothetical protein